MCAKVQRLTATRASSRSQRKGKTISTLYVRTYVQLSSPLAFSIFNNGIFKFYVQLHFHPNPFQKYDARPKRADVITQTPPPSSQTLLQIVIVVPTSWTSTQGRPDQIQRTVQADAPTHIPFFEVILLVRIRDELLRGIDLDRDIRGPLLVVVSSQKQ
jgi:hypothetical protein